METTLESIGRQLDVLIRLQRIANVDAIGELRQALLGDAVAERIYELTADWRKSGSLINEVVSATGVADRTVNRRLVELAERGVLESRGASRALEYRRVEQF